MALEDFLWKAGLFLFLYGLAFWALALLRDLVGDED